MCFGQYTFQVGKILTESLFIGSVLCNSEVWYNISLSEIVQLERAHKAILRMILGVGPKSPRHLLYLISGSLPIRHIIMQRRVNYLQHILKQSENSLLFQFFNKQFNTRKKNEIGAQLL